MRTLGRAAALAAALSAGSIHNLSAAVLAVPGTYPTIQSAINAAAPLDVVEVGPGIYAENISFAGKNISVVGIAGANATVLQSPSTSATVVSMSGEPPTALLQGFTIRGGSTGIYSSSSRAAIRGNIIKQNGNGVNLYFSSPVIDRNSIVSNSPNGAIYIQGASTAQILGNILSYNNDSSWGGGAAVEMFAAGDPIIRMNLITFNTSTAGIITMVNRSDALIEQNLIYGNAAGNNGTIGWLVPSGARGPRVHNNTIAFNNSASAAGIAADGYDRTAEIYNNIIYAAGSQTAILIGGFNDQNPPLIRTNIVFSETGAAYAGVVPVWTGPHGNLSVNPLFTDSANRDFTLLEDSPAIDMGLPLALAQDFIGAPRPLDGNRDRTASLDLGAFEFVPANSLPVAHPTMLTLAEDSTTTVELTGSDEDGDNLLFFIASAPGHGTLSGTPPNVVYTPVQNFYGLDSFTYVANDPYGNSQPATVSIEVTPANDVPTAGEQQANGVEDAEIPIVLAADDIDGDSLTFEVYAAPQNGTLSGEAPNLTYTPGSNFNGTDSFAFSVTDGQAFAFGSVTITVAPVNDPPIANDQSAAVVEDGSVNIALSGSDPDGDALAYTIVSGPSQGTLSGAAPNLTYAPSANYNGGDSFQFEVSDGQAVSLATVTLTVAPVNDTPIANSQSATVVEDGSVNITLSGSDADGDALAYTIVSGPSQGTLSGAAPNLTYAPAANYNGGDSFHFEVSDGQAVSLATVTLTVAPVNDAPIANGQSAAVTEDGSVNIALSSSDPDGDALAYAIVSGPSHGTLSGTAPNLTYAPAANYSGGDSFQFEVSDGQAVSLATVTITVAPVNDAPIANGQSITILEDQSAAITLSGLDVDGDLLGFAISAAPAHGSLSGSAPNLTYTPAANRNGADSFQFTVSDGAGGSGTATIAITVTPVNDAPTFALSRTSVSVKKNSGATTIIGMAANISAGDQEAGQSVSFVTSNNNPVLFEVQPSINTDGDLTFRPKANRRGTATVSVFARDNGGTANGGVDQSAVRTFTINVN